MSTKRRCVLKNLFYAISLTLCFALISEAVQAQGLGQGRDQELERFQRIVNSQRNSGPVSGAAGNPMSGAPAANTNPLGPAGQLPLGGQAASGAMNSALVPASPEELQAQIAAETEQQRKKLERRAFEAGLKELMPLSVDQIRETYEAFIKNREAAETPIRIPEKSKRVETVSLDPSAKDPVVNMVPGYVTTVSFLDSSGAPWPIEDLSYSGKFEIESPEEGGHMLRMIAQSAHGVGNMSLRLVGLLTPVIFTLQSGLDQLDARLDIRIDRPGPLAKTSIIEYGGLITTAGTDSNMSAVLDGTPPSDAEKLSLRGVDGRTSAWRVGRSIYLRTPLTLLSPAWDASVSSADGTKVYMVNDTPVVILSDNGKMQRIFLDTGNEELLP